MSQVLIHPAGEAVLGEPGPGGRRRLTVRLSDPKAFSPRLEIDTTYSPGLVELILNIKGPVSLCDEIARDQDPAYVEDRLLKTLAAYWAPEDFAGKRILDFGCGSGASTMILARAFPLARITGVELNPALLSVAEARARFYGFARVELLASPSGVELPPGIGRFDAIMMNAVFEHLLPEERRRIMPELWRVLNPGGWLFVDETPHRLYHVEGHTTGLPFLNYLPARAARVMVRRFSYRFNEASWPELLREGIRGGTEREILRLLTVPGEGRPSAAEPSRPSPRDRLDLHFSFYNGGHFLTGKQKLRLAGLKLFKRLTGVTYTRSISLAVRKGER